MRVRYKVIKVDEEQKDFMKECKACSCSFCDYPGECTVKENEYIKKVYK